MKTSKTYKMQLIPENAYIKISQIISLTSTLKDSISHMVVHVISALLRTCATQQDLVFKKKNSLNLINKPPKNCELGLVVHTCKRGR